MLKRQTSSSRDAVKVTFALPLSEERRNVSVVGDFNGWEPLAHPLKRRTNGTRSVTIELPTGTDYHFKYLDEGGRWFCEPAADDHEVNEYHEVNSVLRT